MNLLIGHFAYSNGHFLVFLVRNCCSIGLKSDSWWVLWEPTSPHVCGALQVSPGCHQRNSWFCMETQQGLRTESTGVFILKTNNFAVIKLVLISLTSFPAMRHLKFFLSFHCLLHLSTSHSCGTVPLWRAELHPHREAAAISFSPNAR